MIRQVVVLLCVVSAAFSEDLDSIISDIFGSTEPSVSTDAAPDTTPTMNTPCVAAGGEKGECVPYYMCNLKDASGLIDIHVPREEDCESYINVCCTASERVQPTAESETKVSEAPK